MRVNPWTAERIVLITEMWREGQSAGFIAREMGITRSSVMGKIHRLGLDERETKQGLIVRKFSLARLGPRRRYPRTRNEIGRQVRPVKYTVIDEPQPENAVTLLGLTRRNCHWPLPGDPVVLFCGAVAEQERSYCSFHCQMAYAPSRTPKDTLGMRRAQWRGKIQASLRPAA